MKTEPKSNERLVYLFKNFSFQRGLLLQFGHSSLQALSEYQKYASDNDWAFFTLLDPVQKLCFTQQYRSTAEGLAAHQRMYKHEPDVDSTHIELFFASGDQIESPSYDELLKRVQRSIRNQQQD